MDTITLNITKEQARILMSALGIKHRKQLIPQMMQAQEEYGADSVEATNIQGRIDKVFALRQLIESARNEA